MLRTSEERVRLLKNGIERKTIEMLYIKYNGLKIIQSPILFNLIETSLPSCKESPDTPAVKLKQAGQRTNRDAKPDRFLDCIGLFCPIPIFNTTQEMEKIERDIKIKKKREK